MKLCNFSNTDYHLSWYNTWDKLTCFLEQEGLDGIELLLHGNDDISEIPSDIVKGLHLSYYPNWIPFYKQDGFEVDYPNDKALQYGFGGNSPDVIVERFKKEYQIAKKLKVKYMVFHVAHVSYEGAFTRQHEYDSKAVLEETIELVNKVFDDQSDICLLFENLWWPGLNLQSKEELDALMSGVHYKNKGVMLDLSHLLLTNPKVKDLNMGVDYILKTLDNLEEHINWIKGIHINSTNAYEYYKEDHKLYYEEYLKGDEHKQFELIYKHISSLDQHVPFDHHGLKTIIDKVKPLYQMIEVVGHNRSTWENHIKTQLEYM